MIITENAQALLDSGNIHFQWLIFITAKDREDGNTYSVGLSTTIDDINISIGGVARTYIGASGILSLPDFTFEAGTDVQTQTFAVSGLSPQAKDIFRYYDSRYAPVEFHLLLENPTTGARHPILVHDGFINSTTINSDASGETIEAEVVSSFRAATKTLNITKSDTNQRLRNANDEGRKYSDNAGKIQIFWGRKGGGTFRANSPGSVIRKAIKEAR